MLAKRPRFPIISRGMLQFAELGAVGSLPLLDAHAADKMMFWGLGVIQSARSLKLVLGDPGANDKTNQLGFMSISQV